MSGKFEYPSSSEFEHIGSTSESALSKMNLPVSALCLTLSKEPQYNSRSISSTFLTLSNCQWFEALKPSFVEMVRPEGRSIIELLTLTSNLPAILSIRAEVPLISFFRIIPPSFKSRVSLQNDWIVSNFGIVGSFESCFSSRKIRIKKRLSLRLNSLFKTGDQLYRFSILPNQQWPGPSFLRHSSLHRTLQTSASFHSFFWFHVS